jgi:hypothetical protein
MATRVFISYRREDSAALAGRVHDRLRSEFGRHALFMDVDTVRLGVDFAKVLHDEVAKCDVLLAVIGPNWLNARDEEGNRRLDDPNDFPRIEIAAALQRDIPVIPILVDGARIPKADQLPKDLDALSRRNALDVRNASFHGDINRLIQDLKRQGVRTAPWPVVIGFGYIGISGASISLAGFFGREDLAHSLIFILPTVGMVIWMIGVLFYFAKQRLRR